MSERELVDAYLGGKIGAWVFVRRLAKAGVSVGAAVAFAAGLPAAAQSGNFSALERLVAQTAQKNPDDAAKLERLMEHVAEGWVRVADSGDQKQLGHALAKLGLNAAGGNENQLDLTFNDMARKVPVNVNASLNTSEGNEEIAAARTRDFENWNLSMAGTVGNVEINLDGYMNVNADGRGGPGHVNLNLSGNAGNTPVNFNAPPPENEG